MSKKLYLMIVLICVLVFSKNVNAISLTDWSINGTHITHESWSFWLKDVESAQSATVSIVDSNEKEVYKTTINITNATQKFDIAFQDTYIRAGSYTLQIYGEDGELKAKSKETLKSHEIYSNISATVSAYAYPDCFVVYSKKDAYIKCQNATIKVGFQTYTGKAVNGKIIIPYPLQEIGTSVEYVFDDGFGCETKGTITVCNRSYNVYFSDIKANNVSISYCPNGSQIATSAYIEIAGNKYDVSVNDYTWTCKYKAKGGDIGKLVVYDDEGGMVEKTFTVPYSRTSLYVNKVTQKEISGYLSDYPDVSIALTDIAEVYAIIDGVKYIGTGDGDKFVINTGYVKQGAKVSITVADTDGYIYQYNGSVPRKKNPVVLEEQKDETYIKGYLEDYGFEDITKAYLIIDGKTYNGKILGGGDEFYINYPAKRGASCVIYVETTDGFVFEVPMIVPNINPEIDVDKITADSTKVTGYTVDYSSVTIKVGKKEYTVKADDEGEFSVKISKQKPNTKIKISVVTPNNHTQTKTVKVNKVKGTITCSNTIIRTTKTLKIKVTKASKGDKIKIKIGSKTYTKKIKNNKKTQTIKINVKNISAGQKVNLYLYDKYGNKKASGSDKVYYDTRIWVGMTEKQVLQTTWGKPDYKNDWGTGSIQWVYERGSTTLYVYVRNGKVVDLQQIRY